MDKPELTEENLKNVLVEEYTRAVGLRPDCEEGFSRLNPDRIRVFIYENEVTIEFPCLQVESCAYWCATRAAEETSKRFFGNKVTNDQNTYMAISGTPLNQFNFSTTSGCFEWRHRL